MLDSDAREGAEHEPKYDREAMRQRAERVSLSAKCPGDLSGMLWRLAVDAARGEEK